MKTIYIKIVAFLIIALLFAACQEDFLDIKPLAATDESSFYSSMESVELAVTACYSAFKMEKTWDLCIVMTMGSIASDEAEAGAGGKGNVVEFQAIDQLRHNAQTANVFEWSYGYLYRGIGYCNVALDHLPGISKETDPNYNAAVVRTRLAEVRFIRAFTYFTLVQLYGGVPLVDHVLLPSEFDNPRNEISEIFEFIKSDLRKAIPDLKEKSQNGSSNVGRASKGAARALLSKVYLYESSYAKNYTDDARFDGLEQHWDSAAFFAEEVINSNEYRLVGADGERYRTWRDSDSAIAGTNGYQLIFMEDGKNSDESVWDIQSRSDGLGWFNTRGNGLTQWTAPARVENVNSGEGLDYGWGWWCPTDFLVSQYETGDPRYRATVLEEDDSVLCNIAADNGGITWRKPNYEVLFAGTGLHRGTKKFEASPEEFWNTKNDWSEGPINIKMIRYADVLLFASEAYFEMGIQSDAVKYINMVRQRARACADNPPTGLLEDLTTVTHNDIVHERLVELALEGHRYFDLIRWDLGVEYLNHILADGDKITYVRGKHEFYPLPDAQVGLSSGLEQYPEWE